MVKFKCRICGRIKKIYPAKFGSGKGVYISYGKKKDNKHLCDYKPCLEKGEGMKKDDIRNFPKELARAELNGIIGETFPPKRNPEEVEAEIEANKKWAFKRDL